MFNEHDILFRLNKVALDALEEKYQESIDAVFNDVPEPKIYETSGLRSNLKAQISSIKSLMSAARERGDESAVAEYETHLENLRHKRNSVKEDTLYTFDNGEIVELSEGKKEDMIRKFMSHDPEAGEQILAIGKKSRAENKAFKSAKKEIDKLKKIGEDEDINEAKTDDEAHKVVSNRIGHLGKLEKVKKYKDMGKTYHAFKLHTDDGIETHVAVNSGKNGWVVNKTHTQKNESLDESDDLKVGDKVVVRPPAYPNMKWNGVIKRASKHGKDFHRVEYEYDGMGGGKSKSIDTFHKKHLTKIDEEVIKSEVTHDDIEVDKHHNGAWHLSKRVGDTLHKQLYLDHTKKEALNHFRNNILPKNHMDESEKTLWDEKKDKWLDRFTKDQKKKKENTKTPTDK
jgi:hypothetical protein